MVIADEIQFKVICSDRGSIHLRVDSQITRSARRYYSTRTFHLNNGIRREWRWFSYFLQGCSLQLILELLELRNVVCLKRTKHISRIFTMDRIYEFHLGLWLGFSPNTCPRNGASLREQPFIAIGNSENDLAPFRTSFFCMRYIFQNCCLQNYLSDIKFKFDIYLLN